jgi:hypothetical protein
VEVDILVNNAGVGLHGPFAEQDVDAITRLVMLNVTALTTLARLALPQMLARRSGRILKCGVPGRLSTRRTAGRGVLRDQVVRPVVLEGPRPGIARERRKRDRVMSRTQQ